MKFYSHLAPSTPSKFAVHTALCIAIETFLLMTTETSFPTLDKESPLPSETALLLQAVPSAAVLLSTEAHLPPFSSSSCSVVFLCSAPTQFCSFFTPFFYSSPHAAEHLTLLFLANLTIRRTNPHRYTPLRAKSNMYIQVMFFFFLCFQNSYLAAVGGVLLPCSALHQIDGAAKMTYILFQSTSPPLSVSGRTVSVSMIAFALCQLLRLTPLQFRGEKKLLVCKNFMFLLSQHKTER